HHHRAPDRPPAMSMDTTPPVCCHCGRLMQFVAAIYAQEHWRCPDGQWALTRTVPAPPAHPEKRPETHDVEVAALTTREAAKRLGCSPYTAADPVRRGEPQAWQHTPRGRYYFDPAELRRYVERHRVGRRPPEALLSYAPGAAAWSGPRKKPHG